MQDAANLMMDTGFALDHYAGALSICGNDKLATDLSELAARLKTFVPDLRQALGVHMHAQCMESAATNDRLFMAIFRGVIGKEAS